MQLVPNNFTKSMVLAFHFQYLLILPPAIIGENFDHANFLSCIKDCIEDMVTFTTVVSIRVSACVSLVLLCFSPNLYTLPCNCDVALSLILID
jgi:hypothetical protein